MPGLHGNKMADELADQGVRMHGVRMEGQERPTLKQPADWARDKRDQEQGSQPHRSQRRRGSPQQPHNSSMQEEGYSG